MDDREPVLVGHEAPDRHEQDDLGPPRRSVDRRLDLVEVDAQHEPRLLAAHQRAGQRRAPGTAMRPGDDGAQLARPRLDEMVVHRLDDDHRAHLVDRGVDEDQEQADGEGAEDDDRRRAVDRVEPVMDGGQLQQRVDPEAHEEAEVELVQTPAQELVEHLRRERAGRLLDGDEQEREGDRGDGNHRRGDRLQDVGADVGAREEGVGQEPMQGLEEGRAHAVQHVGGRAQEQQAADHGERLGQELGEGQAQGLATLAAANLVGAGRRGARELGRRASVVVRHVPPPLPLAGRGRNHPGSARLVCFPSRKRGSASAAARQGRRR
jgi:hypothetical protein